LKELTMQVLENFEFGSFGRGKRGPVHPWAEWADGKIRQFEQGKDFTAKPDSFATQARDWAKKNGKKVRINMPKGGNVVTLQFYTELPTAAERERLQAARVVSVEPLVTTGKGKSKGNETEHLDSQVRDETLPSKDRSKKAK
jgi:hypothetical protein